MVENDLPETENAQSMFGVTGSSVKGILILLFALGVCFSYFYFFTDILRPTEETPMQIDISSSEVKKPLPERAIQTAATSAVQPAGVTADSPVPPVTPPATTTESAQKQIVTPDVKPLKTSGTSTDTHAAGGVPSVGKPAAAPTKSTSLPRTEKEPSRKMAASETGKTAPEKLSRPSESVKPAAKKVPEKTAAKGGVSSSPQKKSGAVEAKAVSSPGTKQKVTSDKQSAGIDGKSAAGSGKAVSKKDGKGYSLVVGTYVLESTLKADKAKLEKAGLHPSIAAGPKKNQQMNRLIVAEFESETAARAELDRVKTVSKDAFLLRENGKFTVYAGSYYHHDRAVDEQERLRGQGFAPILKKSVAPVGSWKLTVGGFPTRDAAQEEAAKLRTMGFKPAPIQSETK